MKDIAVYETFKYVVYETFILPDSKTSKSSLCVVEPKFIISLALI